VLEHLIEPGRDFARLARAAKILFKAAVLARRDATALLRTIGLPNVSPYARTAEGLPPQKNDDAFISVQPLEHLNAFSGATMRWLGDHNDMTLISRVRLGSVGMDLSTPKLFAQSLKRLGVMGGKMLLKPDKGYFLFRRKGA
jgi:hypothetical protein